MSRYILQIEKNYNISRGPDGDDVGLVNEEEEEQERVRVIVNPNPPKRGTKSLRDHHEATAAMTEMVVDAATLEMAAPMRHLKRETRFGYPRELRKKKQPKNAQNLDWIIDAVAKVRSFLEFALHMFLGSRCQRR